MVVLPNGTRLEILDENIIYKDDQLSTGNSPTSDEGIAMHGPVHLERVRVITGAEKGIEGWVRGGLQRTIAMP
jgi:hypothetical protein